eukprot:TRINITY_DN25261_c0_g1_i1.p1 TRINITY_DN25261_c0_g1~~TRINITY_DN25261_c0_g1_i1.p1  ORF type:complete len:262 (+),score=95.77 TRINITY_DN25261_c0_g1_i1:80-865(+)
MPMSASELTAHVEARYGAVEENPTEERKAAPVPGMAAWLDEDGGAEVGVEDLPGGLDGIGVVMNNVLSREECRRIIDATEGLGYGLLGKSKTGAAYRGNTRVQVIDAAHGEEDGAESFTDALWRRIAHLIPAEETLEDGVWRATGLNPFYRFAKYTPGQGFAKHVDKQTVLEHTRCSILTVNVYLNDVEAAHGGRTRFYGGRNGLGKPVAAAGGGAGSAAVFKQTAVPASPWHDGEVLKAGVKYLLRTDVLYEKIEGEASG